MQYKGSFDFTFILDSGDQVRVFGADSDFVALSLLPNGGQESVIKLGKDDCDKISKILSSVFYTQAIGKKV